MKEQNGDLEVSQDGPNEFGETAIDFAPHITLANGFTAIPQQFFRTEHSMGTLEAIVARINTPPGFIVFVGEALNELFIQVGIVGIENYPKQITEQLEEAALGDRKIVYSRRWLVEKSSPTSEVIQTVLLAIKKAREHELREKIYLDSEHDGGWTTPFNCHMDLPLMAANKGLFDNAAAPFVCLAEAIKLFRVSTLRAQIVGEPISIEDSFLVLVKLENPEKSIEMAFPDLVEKRLYLMLSELSSNELVHELVAELVSVSDRYVEENFAFNGFKRFSRSLSASAISKFSLATRIIDDSETGLRKSHEDLTYEIDSRRVPSFSGGELGSKQRQQLSGERKLAGHLPFTFATKHRNTINYISESSSEGIDKSKVKNNAPSYELKLDQL